MQYNASSPNLVGMRNWEYINEDPMDQRLSQSQIQAHSRDSSSQSTTADSSPVSLTFSTRSGRMSGSASSLSTTPPHYDLSEYSSSSKKSLPALPDVAEDPSERDVHNGRPTFTEYVQDSPISLSRRDSREFVWQRPNSFYSSRPDFDGDNFFTGSDEHLAKRRRSGETSFNNFATRIVERFPSFSRRKRASTNATDVRGDASPSILSRSSSFKRAFATRSLDFVGSNSEPHLLPSPIETIVEDDNGYRDTSSPMDVYSLDERMSSPINMSYSELQEEVPEPLVRSSTPLLPPLMDSLLERQPIQSPLISPTVAAHSTVPTGANTPIGTSMFMGPNSPNLSPQASTSSFGRSRATTLVSSASDVPPLVIDDDDEWADKLGHANFFIFPQPWIPDCCDLQSCKKLLGDWEIARSEFAKHLSRTEALFGPNSRTTKVTQEKWASIDAEWKRNNEEAAKRAAESGATPFHIVPVEPAPLPQLPMLDDPRLMSGCDMDIVGPMTQILPQIQSRPSKRAQLMKMIGLQVPYKVARVQSP